MRNLASTPEPPIVVLRSNDCCFLGIVRSCVAAGHRVVPIVYDWPGSGPWYSEHSDLVKAPLRIPNPYGDPAGALAAMIEIGRSLLAVWRERLMVVPSSDTNLMFLVDHHAALAPYFRLAGGRAFDEARMDVVRKDSAASLLAEARIPIPRTWACLKPSDIHSIADQVSYPCIYKPVTKDYGQTFYSRHGGLKAIECSEREELVERLAEETSRGFELVVQEKVEFRSNEEEIPFYLYSDREFRIRMAATGIKEKIQPYPYGTATVLRLSWHEELLPIAQRVVEALSWRGILMIEFIRDATDGVWKVIEVNARPWLCVDFYRRSGMNFLDLLYRDWRDEPLGGQDVIRPSSQMLDGSPVHVSLPTALGPEFEALTRPATVDDVVEWLTRVEGRRSLTFLDPSDPGPGQAELRALAKRYSLPVDELIDRVGGVVCGD